MKDEGLHLETSLIRTSKQNTTNRPAAIPGAMELSTILALSLVLLLTVFIFFPWSKQQRYRSLPPGPSPIPLLGTPKYIYLKAATKNFPELSQKYGSVFTIWNLSEPVVVLCGYETVKDALINHAEQFSARPMIPVFHASTEGYGINGPRWRSLRRFTISILRNFGMGKKNMEMRVLAESKYLVQAVSETGGKPFDPTLFMGSAVGNIISTVLFGEQFDYKDEKLQELLISTSRYVKGFSSLLNTVCNIVPVLLKFPIIKQRVFRENIFLKKFVTKYIEEHRKTLNPEAPRNFIDYFLLKIKEVEHETDPDLCDTSLLMMVVGLLAAGTETTASTLKFILILMAHYPEVQEKVQQEIDEVTKSLRSPEIMDKPQLAYTNAVIHEAQRVFDLAPTSLSHAVSEDIKFRGYTIPMGTAVIPFLTSVLQDPSQWETPGDFNPQHFLNEDGQFRTRLAFMAFSAGKRACLGENLARMELFLIFSALLQKFTFTLPPGTEHQDLKYLTLNKVEIMASAQICAVPRVLSK
ncbi:cytochrome P450 2C20-like isoform X2 [Ranitomeya imitator]|uniref:cytochrome P450 2C20-like isoform X2 n=1 Tax=Ranitomeya imitator TaxID=111125 RepID=UPI0037E73578